MRKITRENFRSLDASSVFSCSTGPDGREYAVLKRHRSTHPNACSRASSIFLQVIATPLVFAVSVVGSVAFGFVCDVCMSGMVPLEEKVARGIRRARGEKEENCQCFKWWCSLNTRFADQCTEMRRGFDVETMEKVEIVEEETVAIVEAQPARTSAVLNTNSDPLKERLIPSPENDEMS